MASGDGDTAPNDIPAASPVHDAGERPPAAAAERQSTGEGASPPGHPHREVQKSDAAEAAGSRRETDRYRRCPGWASRWTRGQVLARHRDGTEVGVVGSAALTWMALDPSVDVAPQIPSSPRASRHLLSAPASGDGDTVAGLVGRIERGWPEVGPVTATGVEEALATLLNNLLVERVSVIDDDASLADR